jgi:hypothetical protein
MKIRQSISEVRLICRTIVNASERAQVKCSKDTFGIFMESWDQDFIKYIKKLMLWDYGEYKIVLQLG